MSYHIYFLILIFLLLLVVILYLSIFNYNNLKNNNYRYIGKNKRNRNRNRNRNSKGKIIKTLRDCQNNCTERECNFFRDRLNNFDNCVKCKKKNMCYSEPQNNCIKCSEKDLNLKCNSNNLYGCKNDKKPFITKIYNKFSFKKNKNTCQMCWLN